MPPASAWIWATAVSMPGTRRCSACPFPRWLQEHTAACGACCRSTARSPRGSFRSRLSGDLLREVVRFAHLIDERQLCFEPVGVLFFALEDGFEELARAVVTQAARGLDPGVQCLDGGLFDLEIETKLLLDRLSDVDLAELLQDGHAFEIEDALHQPVGVPDLAERFCAYLFPQTLVAPVLAHACVDPVLVDRGELGGQDVVEELDDLVVALHGQPPESQRLRAGARG